MAEETKHTPGPWNVCMPAEFSARAWTAEQMQHMWWVGKRPGVAVALIDGSEAHSGEADARLIAAAPDLLVTSQALLIANQIARAAEDDWQRSISYDDIDKTLALCKAYEDAQAAIVVCEDVLRAAIAKALGRDG